jgi:hypothetical protein
MSLEAAAEPQQDLTSGHGPNVAYRKEESGQQKSPFVRVEERVFQGPECVDVVPA